MGFLHNTVSELEHALGRVQAEDAIVEVHHDVIMAFNQDGKLLLHANPENVARYILRQYGIEVIYTSTVTTAAITG